jgi:hypothetical protein
MQVGKQRWVAGLTNAMHILPPFLFQRFLEGNPVIRDATSMEFAMRSLDTAAASLASQVCAQSSFFTISK